MSKICKNCRWWDDSGDDFRSCDNEKVDLDIEIETDSPMPILEFAFDFGCIHFEG